MQVDKLNIIRRSSLHRALQRLYLCWIRTKINKALQLLS